LATVELQAIGKAFAGGVEAIAGVDLAVADGEFLAVVGPSGSGKSTLLRLIAGLEAPTSGAIRIGGRAADRLAPRERDVAMVFQDPAPYPHLSVFENLAFGLRARGAPRPEIPGRVEEVAAMLGLSDCLGRRPAALSGGQRQRVALGRALARRPGILLLDEPFASLDAPLRAAIRADLADLQRRLMTTTILVTHDQAEALALGDRVAVLDCGRLAQVGTPSDVYDRPASKSVAAFVGSPPMSFLPAPAGSLGVVLGLRAEDVRLVEPGEAAAPPGTPDLLATVRRLEPRGHETIAALDLDGHMLAARFPASRRTRIGETVVVRLDLARASWFDAGGLRVV